MNRTYIESYVSLQLGLCRRARPEVTASSLLSLVAQMLEKEMRK